MELQYDKNTKYKEYSTKQYGIAQTFSSKKGTFLPYIRDYRKLTCKFCLNGMPILKSAVHSF